MISNLVNFLNDRKDEVVQIDIDDRWLVGRVVGYDSNSGFIFVRPEDEDEEIAINLRHVTSISIAKEAEGDN